MSAFPPAQHMQPRSSVKSLLPRRTPTHRNLTFASARALRPPALLPPPFPLWYHPLTENPSKARNPPKFVEQAAWKCCSTCVAVLELHVRETSSKCQTSTQDGWSGCRAVVEQVSRRCRGGVEQVSSKSPKPLTCVMSIFWTCAQGPRVFPLAFGEQFLANFSKPFRVVPLTVRTSPQGLL